MATNPVTQLHPPEATPRLLIGELLADAGKLTEHDVHRVIAHQKKKGVRFGAAARALKLVTEDDIQRALASQFDFPYLRREESLLNGRLVTAYRPFSLDAEAFRMLRSQLMLRWFERGQKFLAVVAARRNAGCSTVAANLAISFAQLGGRTLLIDTNFHSPRQHEQFGLTNSAGLADVLLRRATLDEAAVVIPQLSRLVVLGTGPIPPNPLELLGGQAWGELMTQADALFDVVLIDVAPALEFADAQVIAARARGCVIVARRGQTPVHDINAVTARFAPGGAASLGLVIND